jgi:type IV pilus biogenesis protein CpaD/CtpE
MTHTTTLQLALLASLIALAGCDSRDPYLRTDVWQPNGANAGNIAAMVADPHDLISGRGSVAENANEPALAVGHVWLDHPKPLSMGAGSTPGAQSSGGGSGDSGGGGSGSSSGTPGS